jgi:leucyl-tRNA synthetase
LVHQTIRKVGDDIAALKLNTAISSLMILLNHFAELPAVPKQSFKLFLQLLAPLAPHLAAELWEQVGGEERVCQSAWPPYDEAKLAAATVTVAVQVNGKTRGSVALAPEAPEAEALAAARAEAGVAKWLSEGAEQKAIYVPGKIISFVVSSR